MHKECIAMILAGGQGSRLGSLTKKVAKPAVPFGGKYRIIDFTLSNCTNSGIDTVGVLTQYNPLVLNATIGIGSPWDLDRKNGGVSILPPYVQATGGEWYKGTANAIYQNIDFIQQYNPNYVIVLSGDHIYKMDYSRMLEHHQAKGAHATIAVLEVPWEEANRFGIMATDSDGRIVEFAEKPQEPKSNLASMGIYIFDWEVLKKYLQQDEQDPKSSNDFGKNIIPTMLAEDQKLIAYPFQGYWKDVGTISSFWEANMDLLNDDPVLNLHDPKWRVYSVSADLPPHFIAPGAKLSRAMVNEGCQIYGTVEHSVLFTGVIIDEGAVVKDSIIMPNARIGANCVIEKAIVGEDAVLGANCKVSNNGEIVVIGEKTNISADTVIKGDTVESI